MNTEGQALRIFEDLGITLGYLVIGFFILPYAAAFLQRLVPFVTLNLRWTTLGGILFFFTCGLTHIENVLHLAVYPEESVAETMLTLHMQVIHGVQMAAVWTLILGSYFEFVRPIALALKEHNDAARP